MSNLQKLIANRTLLLRCCSIILACAAALAALFNTFDAWQLARLPFEMNYEEGNILNAAVRIVNGLSPYPDPHSFPNVLNPYGPVFYYVIAATVRMAGVRLLLPRLIVIFSALIAGAVVAFLVRRFSGSSALAAATGCVFITSQLIYFWMPLLRVDFFGLALALIGLYTFTGKHWLWSVALFVLALFVKVSMLAAPAACLAYLLLRREWKRAGYFAGIGAAASLIGFVIVQSLSAGWFSFHIFQTHADPFSWYSVFRYLRGMCELDLPLVLLSACYVVIKILDRDATLPILYLLFATLGTVTIGKLGSDSNHLLELHAALTLCAGLGLSSLSERVPVHWIALAAVAGGTAILIFFSEKNPRVIDERTSLRDCGQVYSFVQRVQGEVLSDNIGLLVLTGKPVFISNPFVYRYLVGSGWSDAALRQKVGSQGFSAIVLSSDPTTHPVNESQHWSADVLEDINRDYAPAAHFQCTEATTLLLPTRKSDSKPQPAD